MVLLSRWALIGIPANGSPADETTLPARSDAPSAAGVALGDKKAQAAAKATAVNAVPTVRLAFIVVTFLRCGGMHAESATTAVRDNDTPATKGLQEAQPAVWFEALDKVASLESLSNNGQQRRQRARNFGRPGAEGRAGHRQGLGAHPAGLEGGYFV